MKNLKQKFLVGSFLLLSAFGFSQKPLSSSPNGAKIQEHLSQEGFQLSKQDIQGLTVNDEYYTKAMGLTLVYVGQSHQGIPIHNLISTVAVKEGEIFNVSGKFINNIARKVNTVTPSISAKEAIEKVAAYFNLGTPTALKILSKNNNNYEFSNGNISSGDVIPVKLKYVEENGKLILTQEVKISEINGSNVWSVRVDALTGEIRKENVYNYKISCAFESPTTENSHSHFEKNAPKSINRFKTNNRSTAANGAKYNVLPLMSDGSTHSVESPNHGSRQIIQDPSLDIASPYGWHDTDANAGAEYTITRGNNVYAYENINLNPPGYSPDGGSSLNFDFPYNQALAPASNLDPAITNLFYVNNMAHDIWYQYGFDEAAGNFQENNFGKGGANSDAVNAQAQDGYSINNAYMIVQEDGINPTMEMEIYNNTTPNRDSDFDNLVMIHEFGHGISIRLGGGPSSAQCLGGYEQGGEGWSDWMGLMLTMKPGDQGTDGRSIATYLEGESVTGPGIRPKLYSTDFSINDYTYGDLNSLPSNPSAHAVGTILVAPLWDLTWAYIDKYGFSEDLYHGNAGNNKVMQLVLDGLKLMPCPPGFVDVRNSLLAADEASTGGENACIIWQAFARRGLGYSADQGLSILHNDGTEAFDLPPTGMRLITGLDECGSEVPQIKIDNYTNIPVTSVEYTYTIDGGAGITETWTGSIGMCESTPIPINVGTLSKGLHTIQVTTVSPAGNASTTFLINDKGVENDINTFESTGDELITYNEGATTSLWERGTAAGTLLSNANAGSQVYGTNLDGDYQANTTSYLISQCYDLSNLEGTMVEFRLGFDMEEKLDVLKFEYSKDGGENWDVLGTAIDPDWFNSDDAINGANCPNCVGAQWSGNGADQSTHSAGGTNAQMKLYKHSLTDFDKNGSAEQNMIFRFAFISNGSNNQEGAIIDDFVITEGAALSTQDIEIQGLKIFPVPTKDLVTIQSSVSLENATISLIDMLGRVHTNLSVNTLANNKKSISLKQFATGVYFIRIENGIQKSIKMIIKK